MKRFLDAHPEYPRNSRGQIRNQRITEILNRPVYAGYVEAPDWEVSLRKGHHEPLISFETYQKIQERLNGRAQVPARADIRKDFPLRGAVLCGHCDAPLTACWSKGSRAQYPHHLRHRRGCEAYGKSIPRHVIEGDFQELLAALQPSEALINTAQRMFSKLWDQRLAMSEARRRSLTAERGATERKIAQLIDRITETSVPAVITAYEESIRKLDQRRVLMAEKLASEGQPRRSFDATLRTAVHFLSSPCKLWNSAPLDNRHAVLKLAFVQPLSYVRGEGFRTPDIALPFTVLAGLAGGEKQNGAPGGSRTPNPRCRRPMLYPVELRTQFS